MTRSERLAKEGLIGTMYHGDISVINDINFLPDLRYSGTEFDVLYDGHEVDADLYETFDGIMFAYIH